MKKYLQKAIGVLLLLCISAGALLYVFYDIAQFQYKREAQEEIQANRQLEVIKLPVKEFNNRKGIDEVWVNGNLYDIRSYTIVNDTVLISVLHDVHEESVVQNIVDSFEPNDKYATDNIIHVCKHRIIPPDHGKVLVGRYNFGFIAASPLNIVLPHFISYNASVFTSVIKPPPRYVFA